MYISKGTFAELTHCTYISVIMNAVKCFRGMDINLLSMLIISTQVGGIPWP